MVGRLITNRLRSPVVALDHPPAVARGGVVEELRPAATAQPDRGSGTDGGG